MSSRTYTMVLRGILIVGVSLVFLELVSKWKSPGFVLLFLIVAWLFLDIIRHNKEEQEWAAAWSQLARLTGLSFNAGGKSFHHDQVSPSVHGEYRGRHLSLTKDTRWSDVHSSSGGGVTAVFARTSLQVTNPAAFSLEVQDRGLLSRIFRKRDVAGGDEEFDRYFSVGGSPREFIQKAVGRIVSQKTVMLRRPQGTVLLTDHAWSGTSWDRPSIRLRRSELICYQSGMLTDVHAQIAFMDMLCDLAEMVEEMQSKVVTPP